MKPIVLFAAGYLAALAALTLVGCQVPSLVEPPPPTLTAALEQLGAQPAPSALRAATISGPPRAAIATVRPVLGGMPMARFNQRPIAGQPFTAVFTTRPTEPYPALPMRMIVSLTPPGVEPAIQQTFLPGQAGVTQQGGRLFLDVTFPPQWIGLRLWLQAVVTDRRSLAGELASPVLEVVVGEA